MRSLSSENFLASPFTCIEFEAAVSLEPPAPQFSIVDALPRPQS